MRSCVVVFGCNSVCVLKYTCEFLCMSRLKTVMVHTDPCLANPCHNLPHVRKLHFNYCLNDREGRPLICPDPTKFTPLNWARFYMHHKHCTSVGLYENDFRCRCEIPFIWSDVVKACEPGLVFILVYTFRDHHQPGANLDECLERMDMFYTRIFQYKTFIIKKAMDICMEAPLEVFLFIVSSNNNYRGGCVLS